MTAAGMKFPGPSNVVRFPEKGRPYSAGQIALRREYAVCVAAGLHQEEIAEIIGTASRNLRRWLSGESEPPATQLLLLQSWNVSQAQQRQAA
jgi:DNA-binding transcriptional regulator YiaG